MEEEYLDLVDQNDQVIGKEKRSVIYENKLNNYRVVNAFILNTEGKLWIPRRTATKSIYPLALDMSVGGHVEAGSTYEDTIKKEALEELNIDLNKVPYKEIKYLRPGEYGASSFMKVYEIKQDEAPNFNPDDFIEYFWLTPQEIVSRIESGELAKGDLLVLIKLLYL